MTEWLRRHATRYQGAHLAVGIVILFNAVLFRAQLRSATTVSDMTVHRTLVDWAVRQLRDGHLPLDGWVPRIGLGFPAMHQYQSLPHQLTAVFALIVGVGPAMRITTYALLITWPASVYAGSRILRLPVSTAAVAAVLSPWLLSQPGYGYEASSYTWRGLGVWAQLWAMWLLPIALGLAWRAVDERRHLTLAVLACGGVICLHLQTGYSLLLVVALAVVMRRRSLAKRAVAGAVVGIGSLAISAWLVVPALVDLPWTAASQYNKGTVYVDSFGAKQVLEWLVKGELFDAGRAPFVTVAVGLGLISLGFRARADARARWLLSAFAMSLFFFFGRNPFGSVIDLLPGVNALLLHRFIAGVHLYGLWIASIGIVETFRYARSALIRIDPGPGTWVLANVFGCGLGFLALVPITAPVRSYERVERTWMAQQATADASDGAIIDRLVQRAANDGPGRFYAGMLATNGGGYVVGYARVQSRIQEAGPTDVLGYSLRMPTTTADVEVLFDETNPANYELFNVAWVVQPVGRPDPPNGVVVAEEGGHRLYHITNAGGYLRVVDTQGVISVKRDTIQSGAVALMKRRDLDTTFSLLSLDGRRTAPPSLLFGTPSGKPGVVTSEKVANDAGVFQGSVELVRPAVVVLKSAFHPRMIATVDGVRVRTQFVAPGFAGVAVPAGSHQVVFSYNRYGGYPLWFAVFIVAIVVIILGERRFARRQHPYAPPASSRPDPLREARAAFLAELDARDAAATRPPAPMYVLASGPDGSTVRLPPGFVTPTSGRDSGSGMI